MQKQDNPFKQIEPIEERPRPGLKKRVMSQIEINRALGDIFKVFSADMGRTIKDLSTGSNKQL